MRNEDIEQRIDECCDQYEAEFRLGGSPDVLACLSSFDAEHHARLLRELLILEMELRGPEQMEGRDDFYCEKLPHFADLIRECFTDGPPNHSETLVQFPENVGVSDTLSSANRRIGNYKLLQVIGEGGMGVVWRAEQEHPVKRYVALKLIKTGVDNQQIIARFEAERQTLAMMDHPNIARVLDAGTSPEGAPYFVMELVDGVPFNQYCDQQKLSINERLQLFIPVCNGVQHAHQKGIIHRDLKPSNVLVCSYDGNPVPKVIDFGLAKALEQETKLTDKTMFTEFGQVIGTIQYMSPEQAGMNQLDIDTRTDIYSLGVMLYELLSGSTPIETETMRQKAILQVLATIREQEPPRPSARLSSATHDVASGISAQRQINASRLKLILKGELDWIVMKSIEKDRTRRYDTANSLANELSNYLQGDVVTARPPSLGYRTSKYVRRHKGLVTSLSSIAVLLIAGIIGVGWFAVAAHNARKLADQKTSEAYGEKQRAETALNLNEANLARTKYFLAVARWDKGRAGEARELLEQVPVKYRNFEWYLDRHTFEGSAGTLYGHTSFVNSVAISPDGTRIVSGSDDKTLKVWNAKTGRELRVFKGHSETVTGVAFSPDGTRIVSGSDDKTLKVWNASTGQELSTLAGHASTVNSIAFSPEGKRIISGCENNTLKLWDAATGQELRTFTGHTCGITSVAFSPDGTRVVSGSGDKTLKLWETETGHVLLTLRGHVSTVHCVAFSPDGRRIVSGGGFSKMLKLWDAATGVSLGTLNAHSRSVLSLAFSPDGTQIVSGSDDKTLKLWNSATGQELRTLKGHSGAVSCVAFSPDGTRIVSGSDDNTLKLWNAATEQHADPIRGNFPALSPDGTRIVSAGADNTLKLWDMATRQLLRTFKGHSRTVLSLAYSPDGTRIVSGSVDKTLKLWDAWTGRELRTLKGHSSLVLSGAFSPDGTRVVSGSDDNTLKLWSTETGQELCTLEGHSKRVVSVAFSPDGNQIVSGSWDGTLKLWDVMAGAELRTLKGSFAPVNHVAFSPDGTQIASGSGDRTLKLWDATTGKELRTFTGHFLEVSCVAFSPDGTRIVSGCIDNTLKLWDAATGQELRTLEGHSKPISSCTFSPDGTQIVSGAEGTVKYWNAPSRRDSPAETALRTQDALPKPRWHQQQAESAIEDSDWYALSFHQAWLLKLLATSDESDQNIFAYYQQLRDAYSRLSDAQQSSLRKLFHQAIVAAKPFVDRYREKVVVPDGHDNLLSILDLKTAWKRGDWKLVDGVPTGSVLLEGLVKDAVIEFPYTLPDEYVMTTMVEPLDKPSSLLLRQRMGDHPFLVTLAYGNKNSLELVDRKPIPNETTDVRPLFQQGKISDVLITVKKDSVQVVVDGQTIIDWTGDQEKLSLSHNTPNQDVLAIHTMFCRYRVHRLSIEPLSGKGTVLNVKPDEAR